jgi:hypothetical protein
MSDYNSYDKSNNKRNITRHFISDSRALDLSLVSLILATAGAFLQIGGTRWDVTSHLLQFPETFYTPSHTLLYLGVGLLTIAAGMGGILLLRKRELRKKSIAIACKLFVIGSAIARVAGPSDFLWHQTFGIDGLLSPTHLILATAMLINSVAVVLGLNRITEYLPSSARKIKLVMIPALSALWLTATLYVYLFALPLSQGQHFNFNLHPMLQLAIATINWFYNLSNNIKNHRKIWCSNCSHGSIHRHERICQYYSFKCSDAIPPMVCTYYLPCDGSRCCSQQENLFV